MNLLVTALAVLLATPRALAVGEEVSVWRTTADLSSKLSRQPSIRFGAAATQAPINIVVDPAARYQVMDGFGVSITDASAWLICTELSDTERAGLMASLFGPEGISMSFLRQTIGACDFNRDIYSYDDAPDDALLSAFSVARDDEYIIPVVQQAIALNPALKVIASPWSPPGWMKSTGSMISGYLKPEDYPAMALYFVKYVQAYAARGIPIYAVTPQNEPGYSPTQYPGCIYSSSQEASFIKNNLATAFNEAGIRSKIICYDWNYDGWSIAGAILADPAAYNAVAGSAFHHYGGDPSDMSSLHALYPGRDIWFTEGGMGDWNDTFDNIADEMISIPRNWAKSIVLWNAALDQDNGPCLVGNNPNQGMVTIRSDQADSVSFNPQYYCMGQLSKFVQPGAVRIGSTNLNGSIETVAFENSDGSMVLVVFNNLSGTQTIGITWNGQSTTCDIPGESLNSFVWSPAPAPAGIELEPDDATVPIGCSVSFITEVSGAAPLNYQWFHNGAAIAGAADAVLQIGATAQSDSGSYTLQVSNAAGSVSSRTATLTLTTQLPPPCSGDRLSNISTRSYVGPGESVQIAGFVLRGDKPKTVLIRASGPALGQFGLFGVLGYPVLNLYAEQTLLYQDDGWDASIAPDFAIVGAFAWNPGSRDAALLVSLPPGSYTAEVSGESGTSGLALVEVYDTELGESSTRLANISTRSYAGADQAIQVAGFVIQGQSARKVVIRAAGPALASFGIGNPLQEPVLQIFSGQKLIFTNSGWQAGLAADFASVGAFAWTPGSADAALVVTLPPGAYTAQVSGKNNGTGISLIEVYDEN